MVDIKPEIAEMLSELADVELSFPDVPENVPLIALTETGNSASVVLSGKDRYSVITLQLDIYAQTPEEAERIAVSANGILTQKGIKRSFSQLLTDEKFPRVCMRFRFGIDEETGFTVSI